MRALLTPRWVAAHAVALILAVTFLALGMWQLERLDQRRLQNAVDAQRYAAEPEAVSRLVAAAGADTDSLAGRRTTATGVFDTETEVLIRSQVLAGRAGFDVVTPLVLDDGRAVVVNRGWVPLEMDEPPVAGAAPPAGQVLVEGVLRQSQQRGGAGPEDMPGERVLSRVDLDLIDSQLDYQIIPLYIEVVGEVGATVLPVPAPPPQFDDEGPHLAYAIQWFAFALVGVVGYGFLLRRAIHRRSPD